MCVRCDFASFMTLFVIMWVFAAFGEEILFSGCYMRHPAEITDNSDRDWHIPALVLSVYFGVSHGDQGAGGTVAVGSYSATFFWSMQDSRYNPAPLVLAHGFYDASGLSLIYVIRDSTFFDLAHSILEST